MCFVIKETVYCVYGRHVHIHMRPRRHALAPAPVSFHPLTCTDAGECKWHLRARDARALHVADWGPAHAAADPEPVFTVHVMGSLGRRSRNESFCVQCVVHGLVCGSHSIQDGVQISPKADGHPACARPLARCSCKSRVYARGFLAVCVDCDMPFNKSIKIIK